MKFTNKPTNVQRGPQVSHFLTMTLRKHDLPYYFLCWCRFYMSKISTQICSLNILPVNYTAPSPQTTTSGGSQTMITESLTTSMDTMSMSPTVDTAVGSEFTSTIISTSEPFFQQSKSTLVSATNYFETCPPLHQSSQTKSTLSVEVSSTLLDDNFTTCMRPFQNDSQLRLIFNIQGSSLLHIQVTGRGLDCVQPSLLVFMDLSASIGEALFTDSMNKQECQLWASSYRKKHMTCTYECLPHVPCDGSLFIGVQVQYLSWWTRSLNLEHICDIR